MNLSNKVELQDVKPFVEYKDIVIARTGSQTYLESELMDGGSPVKLVEVKRNIEDVRKSAETMNNIPITVKHPHDFLDYKKSNVKIIGFIKDAKFEDGLIKANLFFFTLPPYKQFSLGYTSNIIKTKDGFKQTEIKVNHLANLERSRCGIICSINKNKKVQDMATVIIGDEAHEVNEKVSAYVDTLRLAGLNLKEVKQKAFEDGVSFSKEQNELKLMAEKFKVKVTDGAKPLEIKQKICDSIGVKTEGKTEEYLTAVIDTHSSLNIEPQSITTVAQKNKYDEYEVGGA